MPETPNTGFLNSRETCKWDKELGEPADDEAVHEIVEALRMASSITVVTEKHIYVEGGGDEQDEG